MHLLTVVHSLTKPLQASTCIWKKSNVKNFISVFIRKKTDFWNLFMTKFEFLYLWMKKWWLVSEKKDQVIFFLSSLLTIISFSCLSLNRHPSLFSILNKKKTVNEWSISNSLHHLITPPPLLISLSYFQSHTYTWICIV